MSTIGLKERLIDKIRGIDNEDILAEAYRLLADETEIQEPYVLNDAQKKAITDARQQISEGAYLTNNEANKEIDEWLNK